MARTGRYYWVDGLLVPRDQPVVRGDDSAFGEGRGCYTTALYADGRARFAERHALRLKRDAAVLQIGEVDTRDVLRAFSELGKAVFPDGRGIVRVQASRDGDDELHVVGVPRQLEEDPPTASGLGGSSWTAITAPFPHPGPSIFSRCKATNRLPQALAKGAAGEAGAEEALLFDRDGRLVEGSRCNVFVVGRNGGLTTPPLERGAVAGIARDILLERIPQVSVADTSRDELRVAEEIIAVNAVRGAVPITAVDGRTVGAGHAPRWIQLLGQALRAD